MDRHLGLAQRFTRCFTDQRSASYRDHELLPLIRQRTFTLALGDKDLNNQDALCADPLLAIWGLCILGQGLEEISLAPRVRKAQVTAEGLPGRFVIRHLSQDLLLAHALRP